MVTSLASPSVAIEQARALFQAEDEPSSPNLRDGYIDLVGEDDIAVSNFSQRAMRSRMVPLVYERVSRPALMRVFVGRNGPGRRAEHRIALRMLGLSGGDRVLDLACGPGNFTRSIAAATGDGLVVGLDASQVMLRTAVRRTSNAHVAYMRGDACALPFRGAAFDGVCCFGALHLFEHPMRALDEIARVLTPGGRVALWTMYDPDLEAVRNGADVRQFGGVLMFAHDEITGGLAARGLVEIDQRVVGKVQFISARKPE